MSDTPAPELEKQLAELTTWQGSAPELWRRALAATALGRRPRPLAFLARRAPIWLVGGVAAAVILIAVGISISPLSRAREVAKRSAPTASLGFPLAETLGTPIVADSADELRFRGTLRRGMTTVMGGEGPTSSPPAGALFGEGRASEPTLERQVVRKATIELATKDVRAAFLKAAHIISEAQGEFVQESSLTGSGNHVQANLTLRVSAERLSDVLNELRQLGEVRSEQSSGEDVTTQVVDLEARLRNEQRVEAELLQLLEKRQDAPLKEVLELRNAINGVRQTIEQLTAQRERLSRLVSLATVLVIIRPAGAPPPDRPDLGAYFLRKLGHAWREGAEFLLDTLSGLVGIVIGGLIWWILLVVAIVWFRAHRRRRAARSA